MISPRLSRSTTLALVSSAAFAPAFAQEWREAESGLLANHVQLTSSEQFRKAGECYFSPDGKQIIFQAIEKLADPEQEESFYQMYVADLTTEAGRVNGIENVVRLSPPGSSNTCGWFHPTEPGVVVFGSTVGVPSNPDKTGYQRESSRYSWQFPQEMDIVRCVLAKADATAATLERIVEDPVAYLAECVIAPNGRHMVFCEHKVAEGTSGGDLLVMDFNNGRRVRVTGSKGYDGGPFFSPDGKRLCYRSDRRGDDLLQVFVAELDFDANGNLLGVTREFQLTDNAHVNWAPFWHPNGRYLIYTTSEMGHDNYEVFVIDADAGAEGGSTKYGTRGRRITFAAKFDGLPVFNADASLMMWTSQRGAEQSSQVWLADFVMTLEGGPAEVTEAAAEQEEGAAERLQVQDPDTGMYYIYDQSTHELSVYNPETHKVREATEDEAQRAMTLFREQ
jgi:TolB protein